MTCRPSLRSRLLFFRLVAGLMLAAGMAASQAQTTPRDNAVQVIDQDWNDGARNRVIPVRLRVPSGSGPFPVILFSHGLGGSRGGGAMWGDWWSRHGYIVIHLQHAGSDEALWREKGLAAAMSNARRAMTPLNLALRVGDVSFAIDEVERRRATGDPLLARADLAHIGLAGHSFGAQTTLAATGEKARFGGNRADPRIRAAIAMSPATWGPDAEMAERYAAMRLPFMSLTGTEDKVPLTPQISPENRTLPYKYMPAPDKYLLVLEGANHMVYNGQPEQRSWTEQNRKVHAPLIEQASLTFWDAYLKGDGAARAQLAQGGGFEKVLGANGRWSAK
jgi:predicted dienelactone hydrolase